MTYVVGDSFGDSPHKLTTGMRHFEQALRVDRPPSALSFATSSFLPSAVRKVVACAFDHAGAQGDDQCGVTARLSKLTSGSG